MIEEKGLMKKIKVLVQGIVFEVWPDFNIEGSIAKAITKEYEYLGEKQITKGGYVISELNSRKAIALAFSLDSYKRRLYL